ncbi:hypothetical protein F2Q70_00026629 [Brassica cretica]|uniref:Uncharacterized protein n=1 Tax=Brassica cretica TaxID=69181 RepID=A0A8S9LBV4_BRACR|nr:hypothetical protein F2Q70_00026629 [Brassica cretica]
MHFLTSPLPPLTRFLSWGSGSCASVGRSGALISEPWRIVVVEWIVPPASSVFSGVVLLSRSDRDPLGLVGSCHRFLAKWICCGFSVAEARARRRLVGFVNHGGACCLGLFGACAVVCGGFDGSFPNKARPGLGGCYWSFVKVSVREGYKT